MSPRRKARTRQTDATASERLEARVQSQQKLYFQRAASLRGVTLKEFMITSMTEAALRTFAEHERLALTAQEQEVFVEALLHPPAPNQALRAATKRYYRMVGR